MARKKTQPTATGPTRKGSGYDADAIHTLEGLAAVPGITCRMPEGVRGR